MCVCVCGVGCVCACVLIIIDAESSSLFSAAPLHALSPEVGKCEGSQLHRSSAIYVFLSAVDCGCNVTRGLLPVLTLPCNL